MRIFSGKLPKESGIDSAAAGALTVRMASLDSQDVVFQFKIVQRDMMSIRAYDPNTKQKARLVVPLREPSLESAMKSGDRADKQNALRIRSMFSKAHNVNEGELKQIAQRLKSSKRITTRG